jgi:hypothetical protein
MVYILSPILQFEPIPELISIAYGIVLTVLVSLDLGTAAVPFRCSASSNR